MNETVPTKKRFRMLTYILLGFVVLAVVFVGLVVTRPNEFTVTRSAKMAAPPQAPFDEVNDFHRWSAWSPWEKIDPQLKRTYEGPDSGVGAIYRWEGNGQVGQGVMTITECKPGEMIRIKLEFIKPFAGICDTLFTFKPDGEQTDVTWTMHGNYVFITKAMSLFMNMDKMTGGSFEQGLASMKEVVEKK